MASEPRYNAESVAVPEPPKKVRSTRRQLRRANNQKGRLLEEQGLEIRRLKAENQRLRDLFDKNSEDLRQALERMSRNDSSDHDWRAEASGLAWMICEIRDEYLFAREALGGDSEFLYNAIWQAYGWVDGPLRDYFESTRNDGQAHESERTQ